METANQLHDRALALATDYRKAETRLLEILIQIQDQRAFQTLGYASLFQYCTQALRLSESQSYALIAIARKSKEIPELKAKIESGEIHLSNARRIVPVLNRANQTIWLEKAATLSQKELEREIVIDFPEREAPERIRPLSQDRCELRVGISASLERKLARVKDLLSQKCGKPIGMEEALLAMADAFIKRADPVEKAKRQELGARPVPVPALRDGKRAALPAAILHSVQTRDEGRCTAVLPNGKRCDQARWTQLHHRKSVAQGGFHAVDNLEILCEGHHCGEHVKKAPGRSVSGRASWRRIRRSSYRD